MPAWHFIIPFYFGKNRFVLVKGGAPVRRKLDYLRQTLSSIQGLGVESRATVFVCDDVSRERALSVHPVVQQIDCPPKHLPLESVAAMKSWFDSHGADNDIVAFTEDDQVLHAAESVRNDIQAVRDRVIFSPHRWARQFLRFRRKGRPILYLDGHRGVLDNTDNPEGAGEFRFSHRYVEQKTRHAAYAACWFMRGSIFRTLDLTVPPEKVELESASYVVFDSGIPVLKPSLDGRTNVSDFVVDHLSGYDYNKRLIK